MRIVTFVCIAAAVAVVFGLSDLASAETVSGRVTSSRTGVGAAGASIVVRDAAHDRTVRAAMTDDAGRIDYGAKAMAYVEAFMPISIGPTSPVFTRNA